MGIGNAASGSRGTAGMAGSLPLMGIGNLEFSVHVIDHIRHLITPHGDRKRQRQQADSLQSMGLITPHGDRKPLISATQFHIRIQTSLPLMGIGNEKQGFAKDRSYPTHYPSWGSETRRWEIQFLDSADLITPHGDRKRDIARWIVACCPTSLPLMGIGNPWSLAWVYGSGPISLPLMGIGNADVMVCEKCAKQLITPHGDRKRGRDGV